MKINVLSAEVFQSFTPHVCTVITSPFDAIKTLSNKVTTRWEIYFNPHIYFSHTKIKRRKIGIWTDPPQLSDNGVGQRSSL